MKRVLITGAGGLVAPVLARALTEQRLEVFCASRHQPAPRPVNYLRVDVTNVAEVLDAIERVRPEIVFHLAGLSFPQRSWNNPEEYLRVNAGGTVNLLEAVR